MWKIGEEVKRAAAVLDIDITELSRDVSLEIIRIITEKYTKGHSCFLWDDLTDYVCVNNSDAWSWINEYIGNTETVMFFNESDEKKSFLFKNGDDLVAVLGETYGFEFYVTNKEKSYLLVFNHHDILMACGDA
jgi:hypothetical protein